MSRFFLIPLLLFFISANAQTTDEKLFSIVHAQNLTGLSGEPNAQKIREDVAVYANYRRFPKSTRGVELWQNCFENPEAFFFCPIILNEREKTAEPGTDKEKRKKFFDALLSLDSETTRKKNCDSASKILTTLANDPSATSLHARAGYWLWVCATLTKDTAEAERLSLNLAQRYPLSNHTLMILSETKSPRLDEILAENADWPVQFRSELMPELNLFIAAIEAAMEQKEDGAAAVFGAHINAKLVTAETGVRLYMASLMSRVSASVPSTMPIARVLVPLFQTNPEYLSAPLLKLLFPYDYVMTGGEPKKKYVFRALIDEHKLETDPHLLAGLIHQESALNPRAASPALAYGLSQMLVGTANDQWRKMSGDQNASVTPAMLQDPSFSVKLGSADFQRRLQNFNGHKVLAIASYNAGEKGVKDWLKEVKPIRDQQILADVLFMNRPNGETHVPQYVAAVLSKAFWYARLYPAQDLQR